VSGNDPINELADEIMGPDRVKAVGYWLQVDGRMIFIETRSREVSCCNGGTFLIVDKGQS